MTTLKERLRDDLTVNLKAHNELETSTLRAVLGAVQTQEKAGKTAVEFDDEGVIKVLAKEAKQRRESALEYAGLGVNDRATRENAEADFIARYLPVPLVQFTEVELEAIVVETIADFENATMRDFGKIMKAVLLSTKGKADGKAVSALVKDKLHVNEEPE